MRRFRRNLVHLDRKWGWCHYPDVHLCLRDWVGLLPTLDDPSRRRNLWVEFRRPR